MKKSTAVFLAAAVMTAGMGMTAYAGQWQKDTTGWWYLNDDGGFFSSGWQWIDGRCYYFTPEGYCLIDCATPDGYTVDKTGAWTVNGLVQTQGTETLANLQTWVGAMDYYDGPQGTPSYFGVQIQDAKDYVPDIYALYDSTGTIPYTVENMPDWIHVWDVKITGEIFESPLGDPAIKVYELTKR